MWTAPIFKNGRLDSWLGNTTLVIKAPNSFVFEIIAWIGHWSDRRMAGMTDRGRLISGTNRTIIHRLLIARLLLPL